jgi:hypothetical protein
MQGEYISESIKIFSKLIELDPIGLKLGIKEQLLYI